MFYSFSLTLECADEDGMRYRSVMSSLLQEYGGVGIFVIGSSVVECLTRDRRAAGSSLTGLTALWSLSKTHLSKLSTGSTQEDPSLYILKIVDGA